MLASAMYCKLVKLIHHIHIFCGRQINDACVVSDLGIEIDLSLKYDAHMNKIVGKAYSRIGVLFKAFTTRHVPVLKKAFFTCVKPVLEYASNVWAPYLIKHRESLETFYEAYPLSP